MSARGSLALSNAFPTREIELYISFVRSSKSFLEVSTFLFKIWIDAGVAVPACTLSFSSYKDCKRSSRVVCIDGDLVFAEDVSLWSFASS